MPAEAVIGSEELRRAFVAAGTSFNQEMVSRIRYFAEPVATDAESLAIASIHHGMVPWEQMRTGATGKGLPIVYVAPRQRGTRIAARKRPKFARHLLRRAMEPALERNRERITMNIDTLLARMERKWGR